MKIYIAHNFAARQILLTTVVPALEQMGHIITSRWIKEDDLGMCQDAAHKDLDDILKADALLLYTDQCGNTPGRGKFFELGYAFAQGKHCYLMGQDDSCVFYLLQGVKRVTSLSEIPQAQHA